MEMEDPVAKGTEEALFLLTQKRNEVVFNDLLEYATEICLKKPPVYLSEEETSRYETDSPEHSLVQKIGARSLSTLLEIQAGLHTSRDEKDTFHVSELVSNPEDFNYQPNLRILENTERFGQAIMDESFAILGADALAWVDKLKRATTQDEEVQVIDWLHGRVSVISEKSRRGTSEVNEAAHFYPPQRISPKFIGEYPNLHLQPSCLSASIIAASFFEKAGKPVLHAGVTAPGSETGTELLLHTLREVAARHAIPTGDAALHTLAGTVKSATEWVKRPLAQHGALYVQFSENWVQFDPYNNATHILLDEESLHLGSLYKNLSEWRDILPNLEFSTAVLPDRGLQLSSVEGASLALALNTFRPPLDVNTFETIYSSLETIPEESSLSYLYETCLLPLLDVKHHDFFQADDPELIELLEDTLKKATEPTLQSNNMYDSPLKKVFEKALQKFITWEDTPSTFIHRCTNDPLYRQRRTEDFLQLPLFMAVLAAGEIAQAGRGFGHLSIDVGNPAMRIGMATLSDFARYDNNPLPASFWTNHWPGAVSLIENIDNPSASQADWRLTHNGLLSKLAHPFTSSHNYDKIQEFLSTHRKVQNDGTQESSQTD